MKKPTVWIVNTGGTITSRYDPSLGGFVSSAPAADILGPFPQMAEAADLRILEFCNVNSPLLTADQVFALGEKVGELLEEESVAGAAILHGTATMEESAYLLDLTLRTEKPVVFTGAMLQRAQPDTDGPRNLLHAIQVAAHPEMAGMGVTVVMAGEIHAARDVLKSSVTAPGAMHSFKAGYLGTVGDEGVELMRRPARRLRFQVKEVCPRVQLLKFGLGGDDLLVRACIDAHRAGRLDGLVYEGSGNGNVNIPVFHALKDAVEAGIPVVVASRCVEATVKAEYAYPGSFGSLQDAGAIGAVWMGGTKARVLLMVALAHTRDLEELRRIFASA